MIRVTAKNGDAEASLETDAGYNPDIAQDMCVQVRRFYREAFDDDPAETTTEDE